MSDREDFYIVDELGERLEATGERVDGELIVTLSNGRALEVISNDLFMHPATASLLRREGTH